MTKLQTATFLATEEFGDPDDRRAAIQEYMRKYNKTELDMLLEAAGEPDDRRARLLIDAANQSAHNRSETV